MKRNLYEEIREGFEHLKNNRPEAVSSKKNIDTKIAEQAKDSNRKTKKAGFSLPNTSII